MTKMTKPTNDKTEQAKLKKQTKKKNKKKPLGAYSDNAPQTD